MEKRFQIVTDSSCDLPQALADELDLAVLPLHVLIGEHTYANYLDGREIGFKEFYDKLRNGERATTSAVNVSEFTAVMEGKLKEGLDILFIGFSSGLSTTYQSGAIACDELREKYPERKLIAIDSLCASLGEGLLLYLAAKKQQSGASIDEVADYVRETIPHLCHWFTVDDLNHLKRGGRISAATAFAVSSFPAERNTAYSFSGREALPAIRNALLRNEARQQPRETSSAAGATRTPNSAPSSVSINCSMSSGTLPSGKLSSKRMLSPIRADFAVRISHEIPKCFLISAK